MLAARAKLDDLYDVVIRQQHPLPAIAGGPKTTANELRAGMSSLNDSMYPGTQNFANYHTGPIIDPSKLAYADITDETVNELFKFKADFGKEGELKTINSLPGGGMDPLTVIPEPGTLAMLLFAGFGLGLWGWRRRT